MTDNNGFRILAALSMMMIFVLSGCATAPPAMKGDEARFTAAMPSYDTGATQSDGAIYNMATSRSLFEDYKAGRVGDILTVVLVEATSASNSASTSTSRDTNVNVVDPTILGNSVTGINTDLQAGQSFDGQGEASQSNSLEGSITVTVAGVLPNGNLVVQGEKWIRINRGEEFIRLRGIVRPVDISAGNTVLSTQIADAELAYGGSGQVARSQAQGWLGRFFGSVIWPF